MANTYKEKMCIRDRLMYRSVVVPVGLFAQAFAESHGIGAASLPDGGPACRFKSVVVRDAALSACMDRLYAFARTDSAHCLLYTSRCV